MDTSAFAIWKFKTIEGKLKGVIGLDFETTRFNSNNPMLAECYLLKYNIQKDVATLVKANYFQSESIEIATVPFSEVPELLKKHNLYNIAPLKERHTSSYDAEEKQQYDASNFLIK